MRKNLIIPILSIMLIACNSAGCNIEREDAGSITETELFHQNDEYLNGEWAYDSPENHGADKTILDSLYKKIEDQPIKSIVVVKDGYIISEYYKDGYNEDSVFAFNSCAKSVTSALVGIAIDKGLINDVDIKIAEYFPQLNDSDMAAKKDITIEHLLSFTSGLSWPELTTEDGIGVLHEWTEADNWVEFVLDRKLESVPGEMFNYSTGSAHLLAAIIQKTTEETAYTFAVENLFEPLGIKSVEWQTDPQGITAGGFCISMTSKDAARFGQLYLNGGKWGDNQIISKEWVIESTKIHSPGIPNIDEYGYLWWVDSIGYEMYYAMGYAGQFIFVVPELNLVAVITSDFPGASTFVPRGYLDRYIIGSIKK